MALSERQVKWLGLSLGAAGALAFVSLARRRSATSPSSAPPRRVPRAEVLQIINAQVVAHHPRVPTWFAMAQAEKESGFNPLAQARTAAEDSFGLYQINWRAHGPTLTARGITAEMLLDPAVNAAYAFELFEQLRRAAIARGFPDGTEQLWHAVRLRLKGIPWEEFDGPRTNWSPRALATVAAFEPVVARYLELA